MRLKNSIAPLAVFSAFANVLLLVAPLHMMQVYDRVLSSGSTATLLYITLIAFVGLAIYGICEAIRNRLAQRMSAKFATDVADDLFGSATALRDDRNSGRKMLRNFNTVKAFLGSKTYISLFDLPFAPLFLAFLFLLHFQIGLLTLFGICILAGIAVLNMRLSKKPQKEALDSQAEATAFANVILDRSEDIRAMGLLPQLVGRWGNMTGKSLNAQDTSTTIAANFYGITKAVRSALQVSIMAWGAFLVLVGDMSGGLIFAASMISGRALQPIEQFIAGWESINKAKSSWNEMDKFLQSAKNETQPLTQPMPTGVFTADNVSCRFGEVEILRRVSFTLNPGELMVIVGPSGGGKSTLARILAGATVATSGHVLLDGCEQQNWPQEQWGKYVGYLSQDIMLFPGTIAENIARMDQSPSETAVIDAAKMTGIHDMINKLPEGYSTRIGDGGFRLSGGQLQRIALARALYTSPHLLVLDEPNANLDQEGEILLSNTLVELKRKGVTIMVVTHRKKLLEAADKVLLVKDGSAKVKTLASSPATQSAAEPQVESPMVGASAA